MKITKVISILTIIALLSGCRAKQHVGPKEGEPWRAMHFLNYNTDDDLVDLAKQVPVLAENGINVMILEVDYHFEYQSHPELRQGEQQITKDGAREFAKICRQNGIRLLLEFQTLGHQSWAKETFPLLTKYPEFDVTPGAFPGNEGLYCREWDPTNPKIHPIIFSLLDELIDAFQVDGMHLGMDEVFLLGSEHSPSTKGKDPAELYAGVINEFYDYLVKKRGVELLMWGDRLIDGEKYKYGEWEASLNGTASAIDMIPKDIIICDWHYEPMDEYPSIPMFIEKGFRVLPTSWRNLSSLQGLIRYSQKYKSNKMLGHLFTAWGQYKNSTKYKPMIEGLKLLKDKLDFRDGWLMVSSDSIENNGQIISTTNQSTKGWYPVSIPSTVMAGLVYNGVYKDPFVGKNLENIDREPFTKPWWYRKEFVINEEEKSQNTRLVFEGVNYKANIWLNGQKIADEKEVENPFRIFEFDISDQIKVGKNVLAVEVIPPKRGDLTIGFVDWNPKPPDNNLGIWRGVKLKHNGAVSINDIFVQSKLNLETLDEASLSITADLINHTNQKVSGVFEGKIASLIFSQEYSLDAKQKKKITFNPQKYEQLNLKNPKLWWPNNLGEPNVYSLNMSVAVHGKTTDKQEVKFGIREVSDYINEQGHRGYKINGKKILIRGGGWVDDMFLTYDEKKLEAQIKYVKNMNLNTIRMEGFWGNNQKIYELCDKYGILVMIGWSCQWEWQGYCGRKEDEFMSIRTPEEMDLHALSYRDQVVWLRNHPSIFLWVFGSDKLVRPALEKKLIDHLAEVDPTRPVLGSCKYWDFGTDFYNTSKVTGPTNVKMLGPYGYVTPNYWYIDKKTGGAYGFNTETGPGPQIPPIESIKKMIPADHLWPIDYVWDFHAGRNEFSSLKYFTNIFNNRYGKADNLESFAQKVQLSNYEAVKAMFEAFAVNKPNATGVIQWMLNAAWPKMFWQLYDWYLMPNGAFYGTQKACQPLNLMYNYADKNIYLTNELNSTIKNLKAEIRILNTDSKEVLTKTLHVSISENTSKKVFDMPVIDNLSTTYFVDLKLIDKHGKKISDNFYWLSKKEDVLDFEKTMWFVTPIKEYADLTGINELPKINIHAKHSFQTIGDEVKVNVTLKNPTDVLAFFIEMQIVGKKSGKAILPIFWDDNYISLLPGETKKISAIFEKEDLNFDEPVFKFYGINVN